MEIQEQFEALVNKGVAKALEPYSEAIIALAKLVRSAEPEAQEERTEAPKAKRKAAEPRIYKDAVEAAGRFSVGQEVRYRQGRGVFNATVYEINSNTGVIVLKRNQDGKIVERPASKVEVS